MKRKKRLRQFRAWVIADGDYRGGPTCYSQLWMFGARGGAEDFIRQNISDATSWKPEAIEVVCKPVRQRKSKRRKP